LVLEPDVDVGREGALAPLVGVAACVVLGIEDECLGEEESGACALVAGVSEIRALSGNSCSERNLTSLP
jgi:hypothetical protein